MMVKFEENEYLVMAMFQMENRQQTMREIRSAVPFLKDDAEMLSIVNSNSIMVSAAVVKIVCIQISGL